LRITAATEIHHPSQNILEISVSWSLYLLLCLSRPQHYFSA
jgi:hypothetical protein